MTVLTGTTIVSGFVIISKVCSMDREKNKNIWTVFAMYSGGEGAHVREKANNS